MWPVDEPDQSYMQSMEYVGADAPVLEKYMYQQAGKSQRLPSDRSPKSFPHMNEERSDSH